MLGINGDGAYCWVWFDLEKSRMAISFSRADCLSS